jgi:hypothetical protein
MIASVIREAGFKEAMLGLSLSYGQTWEPDDGMGWLKGYELMLKLSGRDKGHNKYLESIVVWLDMTAPRYFWSEFDTYRVGVTKQSESTMHTIKRNPLTQLDFVARIKAEYLDYLNALIEDCAPIEKIKAALPEGFLQRRIVCTNYKALRTIYTQRRKHKLHEWKMFCQDLDEQLEYSSLLLGGDA